RRHLPPEIELCAVQLPGRETLADMRPLRTIAEIVAALVPRISAELGLPYAFFGHSMGAFVCFEVARTLAQLGLPPPTLCVVSARRAPQLPQRAPLHALPERELVREIRAFGGTPEEVLADRELMARLLPLLRADLEATESYRFRPGNPLSSPLLALGGANDGSVDLNGLEAWHPHTTSEFQMRIFEGGHFFIKTAQASVLSTIAQQLSAHSAT
ncbi:MAG TPA: alpha/beta fold hydrolase, partial [Polyangiaceae bacterium]